MIRRLFAPACLSSFGLLAVLPLAIPGQITELGAASLLRRSVPCAVHIAATPSGQAASELSADDRCVLANAAFRFVASGKGTPFNVPAADTVYMRRVRFTLLGIVIKGGRRIPPHWALVYTDPALDRRIIVRIDERTAAISADVGPIQVPRDRRASFRLPR